jgi:hypothetical protein
VCAMNPIFPNRNRKSTRRPRLVKTRKAGLDKPPVLAYCSAYAIGGDGVGNVQHSLFAIMSLFEDGTVQNMPCEARALLMEAWGQNTPRSTSGFLITLRIPQVDLTVLGNQPQDNCLLMRSSQHTGSVLEWAR